MRAVLLLALVACGYSAKENELVGQVKKVVEQTPILCGDYVEADVSLGVLRNGGGSMSKEDMPLFVASQWSGTQNTSRRMSYVTLTARPVSAARLSSGVSVRLTSVTLLDEPAEVAK